VSPPRVVLEPDKDDDSADWPKQTWDLPFTNAADLRAWLASRNDSVEWFKTLPVYRGNVDKPGMEWLREL